MSNALSTRNFFDLSLWDVFGAFLTGFVLGASTIKRSRLTLPAGGSPMGLENEKTALQILHGAASQLTHPEETPAEADSDLLQSLLLRRKC